MRTPIEIILEAGCVATGATICQVRGRERHRWIVLRRCFIARKMRAEGYSLPAIGRELGGRHHTTIMHYLRRSAP
jgi:chromosomal replication initiation ATPase DnaA